MSMSHVYDAEIGLNTSAETCNPSGVALNLNRTIYFQKSRQVAHCWQKEEIQQLYITQQTKEHFEIKNQ